MTLLSVCSLSPPLSSLSLSLSLSFLSLPLPPSPPPPPPPSLSFSLPPPCLSFSDTRAQAQLLQSDNQAFSQLVSHASFFALSRSRSCCCACVPQVFQVAYSCLATALPVAVSLSVCRALCPSPALHASLAAARCRLFEHVLLRVTQADPHHHQAPGHFVFQILRGLYWKIVPFLRWWIQPQ